MKITATVDIEVIVGFKIGKPYEYNYMTMYESFKEILKESGYEKGLRIFKTISDNYVVTYIGISLSDFSPFDKQTSGICIYPDVVPENSIIEMHKLVEKYSKGLPVSVFIFKTYPENKPFVF